MEEKEVDFVERTVYTGCYTQDTLMGDGSILKARGQGICAYALGEDGRLECRAVCPSPNPTYLALHPSGQALYATHELMDYLGLSSAAVSSYRVGGEMVLTGRQPTFGGSACHVSLGPGAKHLLVSNYMGGSVCVLPIGEDLSVQRPSCFFQHYGRGTDPLRQASPHVHQAIPDRAGGYVLVSDLGTDEIRGYYADWEKGHLSPNSQPIKALDGSGPRHCAFNRAGDRLYALTEMGSRVLVYGYDGMYGMGALMQTISALPEGYQGESSGACIRLHPDGKWLFTSNRGHDSIAVFRVLENGRLALHDVVPSGGRIPRDFMLTPDGETLICGNQESDELVVFRMDAESGALTEVSRSACPSVTAVVIAP
jgi:6-phosphogluconolactonase